MNKQIYRREFLRYSAIAAGASAIAACAPAVSTAPTVEKQAPQAYTGKLVIVSLTPMDKMQPMISKIEEKFPGVKIDWKLFPSEKFTELFAAAEIAGDQIDIMDLNGQDLRRYAGGKKLLDAATFGVDLKRFRPVGLETYTISGTTWALPYGGISGFPFLMNKKSLEKIGADKEPETYEDLKAMAPEFIKAGIAPFVHQGKNIYMWPVWHFWAYGQTTGNKSVSYTYDTLQGKRKFTDPESVAALEMLYRYAQDGIFNDNVNSTDGDAAWQMFSTGKAAFFYEHCWRIGFFRTNEKDLPALDMSLIAPLRMVSDAGIKRELPGGTGDALGIYSKVDASRLEITKQIVDYLTLDENVKWKNEDSGDPVSCNANVEASQDVNAIKYAKECADVQTTYLDWFWPPEITRSFQEQQQALVAGTAKPDQAAANIQSVFDQLVKDGYKFET